MKKKGDTSPIIWILIVIGLALIVFVILSYVLGVDVWGAIKKIFPSKINVDDVARACALACTTQSINGFCCTERDVIFEEGSKAVKLTCQGDDRIKGDCTIDCSEVKCGISENLFKQFCADNCANDDGKKEKEFCCTNKLVVIDNADKKTNCTADDINVNDVCLLDKKPDCKKGGKTDICA